MRVFNNTADLAAYIGTEIGVSDWIEVDQNRIKAFAAATEDYQWIHLDAQRTQNELGHGTIAHGFLTLALVSFFTAQIYTLRHIRNIINCGTNKVRFMNRVPAGARLRGRVVLLDLKQRNRMAYITHQVTVEIEAVEKPAMVAETVTLIDETEPSASMAKEMQASEHRAEPLA